MDNREVNYPDILPQKQPPTHLSSSCSLRVKIDVTVYNNTTRNGINSWKVIQASAANITNIFEMVNHPMINPESKIRKRHYWLIFKLLWRHVSKIQCNGLVFFFIMTQKKKKKKKKKCMKDILHQNRSRD